MPNIKALTVGEIRHIAFYLAKKLMEWDEPIPPFETRAKHILESCLESPFQTFGKRDLYRGLLRKGALLFYLLIKNHPFQNGNKRVAVTALLVFLDKNKKWMRVSHQELYNFAVWVAESPSGLMEQIVDAIEVYLGKHSK